MAPPSTSQDPSQAIPRIYVSMKTAAHFNEIVRRETNAYAL